MVKGRVSIVIPARNERFLVPTITGLLAAAAGDVEIIPVLDGRLANGKFQELPDDPRIKPIFKDVPEGMRPAINDGARAATGEFLLKADGHVILGPGYDEILKADCDFDWVVVPTRHSIDPTTWTMKPRDFNYTILTYPFLPSMYGAGFHAVTFPWDQNKNVNAQRKDLPIDDIIGAQGSIWFQHTAYFLGFPPLDHEALNFYQENQEVTLRILATGGRSVINKRTWGAHYHKGKENVGADGRPGRGFYLDVRKKRDSEAQVVEWCLNGWPASWGPTTRRFESIVEQHWWLISQMKDPRYAWPADWRDWATHAAWFANRTPDQVPAHT